MDAIYEPKQGKPVKKTNILEPSFYNQAFKIKKYKKLSEIKIVDFFNSPTQPFDFLSKDLYVALSNSQKVSKLFSKKKISLKRMFMSIISCSDLVRSVFNDNFLFEENKKKNIFYAFLNFIKKKKKFIKFKTKLFLFFNRKKEKGLAQQNICFSSSALEVILKSLENAKSRFYTPIVTPEIMFLTILEGKWKLSNKIKKKIKNNISLYSARQKLISKIYEDESIFKRSLDKQSMFFGYLLKKELRSCDYYKPEKNSFFNNLKTKVFLFKKSLLERISKQNIFFELKKDFLLSANFCYSPREYSLS